MGCQCSRVAPAIEPISKPQDKHNLVVTAAPSRTGSVQFEQTSADGDDDDLVDRLLRFHRSSSADTNFVSIRDADAAAFNPQFLQQRAQVINNRPYREAIQSCRCNNLQELIDFVRALSRNKSKIECYWMIFYWIAINVDYDTISYFSKQYSDQSPEAVFRSKRGVCAGYANLYRHICDQLHLPCEMVTGSSKGYSFDPRSGAPPEVNHAWNAVEIAGHWYLIESTWAAGFIDDKKQFEREFEPYFFLPRPEEMIYHHLPEEERWQLLKQPVPMDQYRRMPKLRPSHFEYNLELIYPHHQPHVDLLPDKPFALVLIRAPSDVDLIANLKTNGEKIAGGHRVVFDRQRKVYCCYFAPPKAGKYEAHIYAKRDTDERTTYVGVLDLRFDAEKMSGKAISYPETWKPFDDLKLKVISPKNTHWIQLGRQDVPALICIRAPADVEILGQLKDSREQNVEGGDQVYYDRRNGFWRCYFAPNRVGLFEANIMAKRKSDEGLYYPAVSFKIDAQNVGDPPCSYPKTWQRFYDFDMKILSPVKTHLIRLDGQPGYAQIRIQTADDVELIGRLKNAEGRKVEGGDRVHYDRRKGYWQCDFAPNRVGLFDASIMAKRKSDEGSYHSTVSFKIDVQRIIKLPISFPTTWPLFYDLQLAIDLPQNSAQVPWSEQSSFAEMRITAPNDVSVSGDIVYKGVQVENGTLTQFHHGRKQWQLLFAPQQTGEHTLHVFARRQSDSSTSLSAAAQLGLNVTKLSQKMTFPEVYATFHSTKCQIVEPLHGTLKRGSTVRFHCLIPGASAVQLKMDSTWVDTFGYKDPVFQVEIPVNSRHVTIYAKYEDEDSYNGLVKYNVE